MKKITAEEKLKKCLKEFDEHLSYVELRTLREDLYHIDTYQLSEHSKNQRKDLLNKVNRLLKGRYYE